MKFFTVSLINPDYKFFRYSVLKLSNDRITFLDFTIIFFSTQNGLSCYIILTLVNDFELVIIV